MKNILTAFILTVFLFSAAVAEAALIKGRVVDEKNGELLAGASVYLEGNGFRHVTVTNMKGEYEFSGMKDGHYSLNGFHQQRQSQSAMVSLMNDQIIEMNLEISKKSQGMEVRIKVETLDFDAEDAQIANTSVIVSDDVNKDELVFNPAVGDILKELPRGEYEVVVSTPGFAYVGAIEVVSDKTSEKTMVVHINGMTMHAGDYLEASGSQVQAGFSTLMTAQR